MDLLKIKVSEVSAVCEEADLQGNIQLGVNTVVHPKCRIHALTEAIIVGDRCIFEDRIHIANTQNELMVLGSENLFESGCIVYSKKVGNGNWFEPKAKAMSGSIIGNNCIIGSGVIIEADEVVPDNTILSCNNDMDGKVRRITRTQKPYLVRSHELMIQKYIDTFVGAKSAYALVKNHRLHQATPKSE